MIDVSAATAVAVCDVCGRREVRAARAQARAWLAKHEEHCSPRRRVARDTERRAAGRVALRNCPETPGK